MKKAYQKPVAGVLYFEASDILSSSTGSGEVLDGLYTEEEKSQYNLDVMDYSDIVWE